MQTLIPQPQFDTAQFDFPDLLDGRDGKNRAVGSHAQIDAQDDIAAIHSWLYRFVDSPRTLSNYRKEVERIWHWSTKELKKPLSSLTHEDMMRYRVFMARPSASWVNPVKLPRKHKDWRPFAGPLTPASIRQAEIVVNALFTWLVEAGYLAGNPLSLSRRKKTHAAKHVSRYLTQDQWKLLVESVESMPKETDLEKRAYARTRWVIRLAYITGMRISEMCENTMGGFEDRKGKGGRRRWFLTLIGKGEKIRTVPATSELIEEMTAYRLSVGLPKYPVPGEGTALILPLRNTERQGITRSSLHLIMKGIFARAAGSSSPEDAAKLDMASAHWLRHSRGSHLAAAGVQLNSIRELLGHASLTTTSIYLHGEEDDVYDEIAGVGG